jgi:hypothetical protein
MTSGDQKIAKIQTHFQALTTAANSLNTASDELTKTVGILDEALKKMNLGLVVWVTVSKWADDLRHGEDQIGYCKISGKWGIALRTFWDDDSIGEPIEEGMWLFNDAPRNLRLSGVDKIPELIEQLSKRASDTTKKILEKTQNVRELTGAIEEITGVKMTTRPPAPPAPPGRMPLKPPSAPSSQPLREGALPAAWVITKLKDGAK